MGSKSNKSGEGGRPTNRCPLFWGKGSYDRGSVCLLRDKELFSLRTNFKRDFLLVVKIADDHILSDETRLLLDPKLKSVQPDTL